MGPDRNTRSKRTGLVATAAYLAMLGTSAQTLFVPLLRLLPDEIEATSNQVSWMVTAVLLSGVVSTALLGTLADRYGTRRVLMAAVGCFVVGSTLGALTLSLPLLILARALQGVSMAATPIGVGLLRDLLGGESLMRGLALVSMMSSIGGSLGAVIGGLVGEYIGWRWLFVAGVAFGLAAGAVVMACVPGGHRGHQGQRDMLGAVTLGVGLMLIVLPISQGSAWGWDAPATWGILLAGVATLTACLWRQSRHPAPFIDMRLLRTPSVLSANLATLMVGFGMYIVVLATPQMALLPRSAQAGLGASVLQAGLLSLPAMVLLVPVPWLAGRLIGRHTKVHRPVIVGLVAMAAGYASLLCWHSSLAALMVANVLVLVGVSLSYSGILLLLNRAIPSGRSAEANGLNGVFRIAGTCISSATVTAILTSLVLHDVPSAAAFDVAYVVGILVCFATIPIVVVGRRFSHIKPSGLAESHAGATPESPWVR